MTRLYYLGAFVFAVFVHGYDYYWWVIFFLSFHCEAAATLDLHNLRPFNSFFSIPCTKLDPGRIFKGRRKKSDVASGRKSDEQ